MEPSIRAEIVTRRTYNRPLDFDEAIFETWEQTIDRVIDHQRWLWERALTHKELRDMPLHDITENMYEWVTLNSEQSWELEELRQIMYNREALPSGRTLWLGGTDVSKRREASQFNCSHTNIETVYDVVDIFWLLLQGCGCGFTPTVGTLTGFRKPIPNIEIIRSERTGKGGKEDNEEHFRNGVWTIRVGDSAEAWAKSIGKLLAGKYKAHTLVFDFSQIRPAGERLKGYGWISSGDGPVSRAYPAIANILNKRAGAILTKIDILDICNWLGTVLSSRRSAEIALVDYGSDEWEEFAEAKKDVFSENTEIKNKVAHRQQSNNSLVFYQKPTREALMEVFERIIRHGGSEPGIINGETAKKRAPWFKGLNPSLAKGTKVYTEKGIFNIEELENKSFKVLDINNKLQKAKCKLSGKDQQLWKLTLEGGHEILCTKEHTWPISRKGYTVGRDAWSTFEKFTTDNLKVGDCLKINKRDKLFDGTNGLYYEGFLLGWLQGDGWITKRSDNGAYQVGMVVSYKDQESNIIEKLEHAISKYSNAKFNRRDNGTYELNTQNASLYTYITEGLGFIDKEHIPASLYDSTIHEDFRKGYIDGIYSSDGNVEVTNTGCNIRVCLTSSRYNFVKEMSELLGFYGIKTNISHSINKIQDKTYNQYILRFASYDCIKHFNKLFTLSVEHKQNRLISDLVVPKRKVLVNKMQIKSITKTEKYADVWDIGVYAENHTFTLAYGVTGNCAEILLGNKSFCNLVEVALPKFQDDTSRLFSILPYIARANYRQTCVDFRDGVLQESWHLNNEFLRLCGTSMTGIAQCPDISEYEWKSLNRVATQAACDMARELGTQRPKNVTTVKPSGTLSKVMDTWEGIHKPLGRYTFNWIMFGQADPLVPILKEADYRWLLHPSQEESILFCFPVDNGNFFDKIEVTRKDGSIEVLEVNKDSAITQLERYKVVQQYYCDQNVSNTISYDPSEKDDIVDWLLANWDIYVGVSFLFRDDPTLSAKDLGYDYLPQEIVTREAYEEYAKTLKEINYENTDTFEEIDSQETCAGGVCPVK